jgi:thiamine biosynthesis lipoprotein
VIQAAGDAREQERLLDLFGSSVRIIVRGSARPREPSAAIAAAAAEAVLRRHQRALSRFDPRSELSALNLDPRPERRVSELTAGALAAALWAAERSSGLVDPTLLPALERAGYELSRAHTEPASLREALSSAPARRPASPHPEPTWPALTVAGCCVRRPPGLRFDLGGTAKGLAADRAATFLAGQDAFAIDAGGDIVLGGRAGASRLVTVAHPLERTPAFAFEVTSGAVATSGIGTRIWRASDGFAHHLIDPSTGYPAWTGAIQATALAATALEAERLAKMALLSGPEAGAALLEPGGGVMVLDSGEVILAGQLREH